MLKYYAKLKDNDQEFEIEVNEADNKSCFYVSIDGKKFDVDFHKTTNNLYSIIIDNKSYEVDISQDDTQFEILRNGDLFNVELMDEMKRMIKERETLALSGRQVLEAQMPGAIQKILVNVGDEVKEGDPLLILIAMKMENEITSPITGTVKEIFVEETGTVSSGDKLVIIE